MSGRPNDYPFLKQAFVQRHNRHQQAKSPDRSVSEASFKIDSEKLLMTPPTPYDADDELSETAGSSKSTIPNQPFTSHASQTSDGASATLNTPCLDDVKDESDDKNTEGRRGLSPPLSDDNAFDPDVVIDPICAGEADGQCTLRSGDHRKVTSHIFGRNKRCTHQIPEDCWIKYCRKHYQRQKYRCPQDWFETQLLLIDGQIDKMEAWGGITSWTIAIRKKEKAMIDVENAYHAQHGHFPDGELCRERFLLPYLGSGKTFQQIRNLIDVINRECDEKATYSLPSFELLPAIDERRNPRPKRGAARRALTHHAPARPSVPSTFKLEVDRSTGQLTKTPVSTPRASSAMPAVRAASMAASTASAPIPRPSATEKIYSTLKRSTAVSSHDEDTTEENHASKVKRHRHTKSL
ncbi:MAG: hypothetical protein Q9201_002491 [Fulgogasparrea decipioides]